jgi:hypothetical protein
MSSCSRNRPHWQGIIITFDTIEIRMLIRAGVQTTRLQGEKRQRVVMWQTRTLRSEHSVVCELSHTEEERYAGPAGIVGYNATWEQCAIIRVMRPWPNAREQPATAKTWRHLFILLL